MSQVTQPRWETMRTDESRAVEERLRRVFQRTDAYRYNSASLRIRVIDPRFEGLSAEQRDALVEPLLDELDPRTQADIVNLITRSPSELSGTGRRSLANFEFDEPSPSTL